MYSNTYSQRRCVRPMRIILLALLAGIALISTASAEFFRINHFHADIEVHGDRSVHVTERIDLTFDTPRHGIFRAIPYKFVDALGDRQRTPIDVVSVTDERGNSRPYTLNPEGNVINVRIGDADRYVEGRQVYVISYQVDNILLFLEDRDELYWDITGDQWPVWIDSVSATMRLATDETSSEYTVACYTGRSLSRESACTAEVIGNEALFRSTRALGPYEGLTAALGWDKGIIEAPSAWEEMYYDYNLGATWVFIIPLLVLGVMIYLWRTRGRDPVVRGAVTVQYEPPKHNGKPLTAAEVGTLIDERIDQRDFSASIVGLAAKGYMTIEETQNEALLGLIKSTDYTLKKTRDADEHLTEFERFLHGNLFPGDTTEREISDLKNKFYKHLPHLHKLMYSGLTSRGFFRANPTAVRKRYAGIGIVIMPLSLFVAAVLTPFDWIITLIAGVLTGGIVLLFANAMPAKTRAGARILDHIRGFQEFMNRADRDRIERMGPDVFYEYMPYAIALDVTDQWAKAFEGMLTSPPNWYIGAGSMRGFHPVAFSQSLAQASSSISTATYSSPRGSHGGSMGGGSAGGGGGGGGGGSW
ncbi:DUF2207 domain-containing protein [candidate division GN15 bacterium]|nr:DUF2207 domain-containing protein [candidate division GN15 bacterium]